jgi:hypothetical protein
MKDFKVRKKCLSTEIEDGESDILECRFNNDMCVEIDTEEYSHITLSLHNLQKLIELILKADKYYEKNL